MKIRGFYARLGFHLNYEEEGESSRLSELCVCRVYVHKFMYTCIHSTKYRTNLEWTGLGKN